jgi:hypothetical protein
LPGFLIEARTLLRQNIATVIDPGGIVIRSSNHDDEFCPPLFQVAAALRSGTARGGKSHGFACV